MSSYRAGRTQRTSGFWFTHRCSCVQDALTSEGWWLDRSRSRSPTISLLKVCLPIAQEIIDSEVGDKYVWYPEPEHGTGSFSVSDTWRALHHFPIKVFWNKVVWFSGEFRSMPLSLGLLLGTEWSQEIGLFGGD